MRAFCMSAEQVSAHWEDFASHLERYARATGETAPEQFKERLLESKQQLWGLQTDEKIVGVCITEVISTPRGLVCVISAACGYCPKEGYTQLMDEISKWARELKCVAIRICGRKGWLRDPRWKQTGIIAERELWTQA